VPFQTRDLGNPIYFFGIEITQSRDGVVISQRKYPLDILKDTNMIDCKPVDWPMDPNLELMAAEGEFFFDLERYRRLIGKLIITRPFCLMQLVL